MPSTRAFWYQTLNNPSPRSKSAKWINGLLALVIIANCASRIPAETLVVHTVQPDKFSNIPETIWWAIVTLTTVGYGDTTPVTPVGKILATFIMIIGIGIFALPTAIVTAAILEAGQLRDLTCRKCGHKVSKKPDVENQMDV